MWLPRQWKSAVQATFGVHDHGMQSQQRSPWSSHMSFKCRISYKVWGSAHPRHRFGLVSAEDKQRLDGMSMGQVVAEVAATSANHRKAACKRALGQFVGVCYKRAKWSSVINASGNYQYLGCFAKPEDGARAYDKAVWNKDGWFVSTFQAQ